MQSKSSSVEAYLASIPPERRAALDALRKVILKNLKGGYEEIMQYGMIGYAVPHSIYPAGYHCDPKQPLPFAGLASAKSHMSFHCFGLYADEAGMERFRSDWLKTGLKLDMGTSCIRFKKIEELPLDLIGKTIGKMPVQEFVRLYEARFPPKAATLKRGSSGSESHAAPEAGMAAKPAAKKATAKKTVAKKPITKKFAKKSTKKATAKKATAKKINRSTPRNDASTSRAR